MFDLVSANPMITTMDRSMTLAARRMGLIASNIANIDTPNYHTQDFSFQDALKQQMGAMNGGSMPLARTHPMHLSGGSDSFLPPTTDPLRPSYERNDGNDVNLDRETMLLARTQSAYQLSASFAQTELRKLYQVLRDGAR